MKKLIVIGSIMVLLSGCATYGKKINQEALSKIERGKTTEAEVIALLGKPATTTQTDDGKKTFLYMHSSAQAKPATFIPVVGLLAGGATSSVEMAQISIQNGVVTEIVRSTSDSDLNTGLLQ